MPPDSAAGSRRPVPSFARATLTVGGLTLVSRIAGLLRDLLMAAVLGAGSIADAFVVALKLPNLFRRIFAEGAFSVAFVPLYSGKLATEGPAAARQFAEDSLALMVALLLPLVVLAMLAMPAIVTVIAPGFRAEPETFGLAVEFGRIAFPYLLFISLTALMGGVLNAHDRLGPFAAAPILFNLCLIGGLLVWRWTTPTPGHALAWAVAAAGVAQLAYLAWAMARAGLVLRLRRPRLTPDARHMMRLMVPASIGAGVTQINLFFDVLLASLLPAGSVSYLYYADRLYQLPLGVIGIAIGTALLPRLSRHVAAGEDEAATANQNRAIEYALLFALPAAVALILVPGVLIGVLFERGAFTAADTAGTAGAVMAYAVGIPAYVLVKVLSVAFFARQDTASPVRIAIGCTIANIALSLLLIQWLAHVGIALATGLTAWLNVALLARGLRRRGLLAPDRRLLRRGLGIAAATAVMGAVVLAIAWAASDLFAGRIWDQLLGLLALVGGGAAVYFAAAILLGGARAGDLRSLVRPRGGRGA